MKKSLIAMIVFGLIISPAYAKPPEGKGPGWKHSSGSGGIPGKLKKTGGEIVDETVDAVIDELVGEGSSGGKFKGGSSVPPGLAKKGKIPPGLAKQGKTPPGWQKGGAAAEKKESRIRGWVGKIFRRGGQKEN